MNSLEFAINAFNQENYISISGSDLFEKEQTALIKIEQELAALNHENPEYIICSQNLEEVKQKIFQSLSEEAKEIVNIIGDCPLELKEICLGGCLDKVSIAKLKRLMRKQWKSRLAVRKLFDEVYQFASAVKELNTEGERKLRPKKKRKTQSASVTFSFV